MKPTAPPVNRGKPGTGTARYFFITRSTAAKPSRRLAAGVPCTLHVSRCSLAATPFPSPPLEERGRERRSSFSAGTPDILVWQPAGMSPRTAAARLVTGLLSPALSSKGGEGEPLARCSRPPDACKVQRGRG